MVCFCVTDGVKLLAQIQLRPTQQQAHLLRETIEQANAACTYTSDDAWAKQQFGHYRLHKVNYIVLLLEGQTITLGGVTTS